MQRIVVLLPLISRIVLLLALRPPLLLQRPCSRRCPLLLLHSVSWSVQDDGSPEEEPTTTTTTLFFANDDSPLLQQTGTESLVLELKQHKPMGCTVEESLADRNILFVSSVVSGGNADTTGLRVGDVLSGMTGLFGTVESTQGMDLGTLRTLVETRSEEEPLVLRVVRGSNALAEHERALTDLCSNPDGFDDKVEHYISSFLQDGYDEDTSVDETNRLCNVDDQDCLIDELCNLWAAELLPDTAALPNAVAETQAETAPKIKPWSVRSSPSGTYVRDPRTGQMKNIG